MPRNDQIGPEAVGLLWIIGTQKWTFIPFGPTSRFDHPKETYAEGRSTYLVFGVGDALIFEPVVQLGHALHPRLVLQ